MITAIIGEPGFGKGALMTKFVFDKYNIEGQDIFDKCCFEIDKLNIDRKKTLSYPDRVPIFTDFEVTLPAGYKKEYKTYFINGFYWGLNNDVIPVLYVPPGSKIFLTEVQRYYDSRKSATLPDWVSRAFEMHRHFFLDIFLDLQRFSLCDLNIRDLCAKVILIDEPLKIVLNQDNVIIKCIWQCKEFKSGKDVELYYESKAQLYTEVTYEHDGNIFDYYNSYSNLDKFVPPEGEDFSFLEHGGKSTGSVDYYDFAMPKYYRSKKDDGNKSKKT